MKISAAVPEKGFYYHYRHDPAGPINNYAYQVMGVGWDTEAAEDADSNTVVYRPLYSSSPAYKAGALFWLRPLAMFMEDVTKEGKTFPRFKKIIDPEVIQRLEAIRAEMYP